MTEYWTCVQTQQCVPENEIESILYDYVNDRDTQFGDYIIVKNAEKREFSFHLIADVDELNEALLQKSTSGPRDRWCFISFSGDRCTLLERVLGAPDGPPTRSDVWFRNTLVPDYVEKCLEQGAKNRENCEAVGKMLYQYRFYDNNRYADDRESMAKYYTFACAKRKLNKNI